MAGIQLSFACGLYDRMLPLYTGEVKPAGIDLNFIVLEDPRQIFDRMGGAQEFDLSEMSSSEFISRLASERNGGPRCAFVALPVIASRVFRHSFIFVNRKRITSPKDLEGKKIGVPLYTMSAAIWIRGHLQTEYGVDLNTIRWIQGATNSGGSHGAPSVLPMARPVEIEINRSGRSLSDLMDAGEIDAIIGTDVPDAMRHNPDIVRLFPNYREVEKDFYRRTKIFPIMHIVAIRRDVHEKYPFVATSLFDAFLEAKAIALERMRFIGALRYMQPWLPADLDEIDEVFGGDPWPYGIEANRPTLEALLDNLYNQGVIPLRLAVEDLFVKTHEHAAR